jgi:hypothetical protein
MLLWSGTMYVRATTRKNKDGSTVRYLQLAHNEWDAATGTSRPQVLHSFGREDQLEDPPRCGGRCGMARWFS